MKKTLKLTTKPKKTITFTKKKAPSVPKGRSSKRFA